MPFKKGQSGNKAGRPKRSTNKATTDLRTWLTSFIESNRKQIEKDWLLLEPKDRLILFERLLKFTLPTLQATSLDLGFEKLSDTDLDKIISKLSNIADDTKR